MSSSSPSPDQGRLGATLTYHWQDHGFLRLLWTNLYEVSPRLAPGVWRSNQPGPARMRRYAAMGIRDIVILRGKGSEAALDLERDVAAELGIRLHYAPLRARSPSRADQMLAFLELSKTLPRPWLFHCKSGADRAGLAAALLVLAHGGSFEEARAQLTFRYIHLKSTKTGIVDITIDAFEEAHTETGIGLEDWLRTAYDPELLAQDFAQGRRHGKRWTRG